MSLGPITHNHTGDGVVMGDPPIRETDAIPVPLSLTSRSEALAPVVVPATLAAEERIKLRNGPGLEYDEVTRLDSGTELQIIGRSGEWLQVREAPGEPLHWVASEMVSMPAGAIHSIFEVQPADIPAAPPPKVATVSEEGLNLRDGPGTEYVSMTKLEEGQTISLVEQYQDWFHVAGDDFDGWVHADYLQAEEGIVARVPVTETIPDANPALAGLINADQVNLRRGPGTVYGGLDKINAGAQVNILARHDDWFKIETGYGQQAWVFGDLLDMPPMVQRRIPYTNDIPAPPAPAAPIIASNRGGASSANSGATAAAPAPAPAAPAPAPAAPAPAPAAPAPAPPAPAAQTYVPASGDVAGFALQFVGHNYVYGGASPGAFDCSGLTMYVYSQYGVYLPHNAAAQFSTAYGAPVGNVNNLAPGDLVFFAGTAGPGISHVAIHIGGGRIVHAMSPGLGVQVSNVYDSYWISHYAGAIRPYR
jgi:cell wall-associated NlpC family hydrolase